METLRRDDLPPTGNYTATRSAEGAITRVRYWHEYVMDLMLTNPHLRQGEIAAMLGRSEAWLSRVVNSDAFQELMALRRAELNSGINHDITSKLQSLADIALDQMTERVLQQGNQLPLSALKETCDMALKALGYSGGGPASGGRGSAVAVQVNVHQASPEGLAAARERMRLVNSLEEADATPLPAGGIPAGNSMLSSPDGVGAPALAAGQADAYVTIEAGRTPLRIEDL